MLLFKIPLYINNLAKEKSPIKLFETVKSALLDGITELDAPYACDLHYYLYSLPDHFIYYASAREATADPCKVANMVVYIMGEELLCRIYGDLSEARCLPAEELEDMRLQAQEWFERNPDGLLDIWEDL